MAELSYQQIRNSHLVREAEEQRQGSRKKNIIILILHWLNQEGYVKTSDSLEGEASIDFRRFEVCDNVDLETILQEYESYYYVKFQRYPKIIKKFSSSDEKSSKSKPQREVKNTKVPQLPRVTESPKSAETVRAKPEVRPLRRQNTFVPSTASTSSDKGAESPVEANGFGLSGVKIDAGKKPKVGQIIDVRSMINEATRINVEEDSSDRLLKPLGGYAGYSSEMRELAQVISKDIYLQNPNVRWDDIIGLEHAKRTIKEAVVYPIKYPELFTGILSPWKGLLLYGPPGTGKTLLAKAVATECNTTFFNISASTIVSKWRGDSEKLVRVLFELARFHAPSTIFLDELESIMSQRGQQGGSEHEGSLRMKTELLVQMDGLSKTDDLVFLMAASNLPWELDHAMLRRLEKRIIVDLPTLEARESMFRHHLPSVVSKGTNGLVLRADVDYHELAVKTEGYSGSDIRLVSKEAAMRPVRKVFDLLENLSPGEDLGRVDLGMVTQTDVEAAIASTKPSARLLKNRYADWQKEYESV